MAFLEFLCGTVDIFFFYLRPLSIVMTSPDTSTGLIRVYCLSADREVCIPCIFGLQTLEWLVGRIAAILRIRVEELTRDYKLVFGKPARALTLKADLLFIRFADRLVVKLRKDVVLASIGIKDTDTVGVVVNKPGVLPFTLHTVTRLKKMGVSCKDSFINLDPYEVGSHHSVWDMVLPSITTKIDKSVRATSLNIPCDVIFDCAPLNGDRGLCAGMGGIMSGMPVEKQRATKTFVDNLSVLYDENIEERIVLLKDRDAQSVAYSAALVKTGKCLQALIRELSIGLEPTAPLSTLPVYCSREKIDGLHTIVVDHMQARAWEQRDLDLAIEESLLIFNNRQSQKSMPAAAADAAAAATAASTDTSNDYADAVAEAEDYAAAVAAAAAADEDDYFE
jgi:hypothetical protein